MLQQLQTLTYAGVCVCDAEDEDECMLQCRACYALLVKVEGNCSVACVWICDDFVNGIAMSTTATQAIVASGTHSIARTTTSSTGSTRCFGRRSSRSGSDFPLASQTVQQFAIQCPCGIATSCWAVHLAQAVRAHDSRFVIPI